MCDQTIQTSTALKARDVVVGDTIRVESTDPVYSITGSVTEVGGGFIAIDGLPDVIDEAVHSFTRVSAAAIAVGDQVRVESIDPVYSITGTVTYVEDGYVMLDGIPEPFDVAEHTITRVAVAGGALVVDPRETAAAPDVPDTGDVGLTQAEAIAAIIAIAGQVRPSEVPTFEDADGFLTVEGSPYGYPDEALNRANGTKIIEVAAAEVLALHVVNAEFARRTAAGIAPARGE